MGNFAENLNLGNRFRPPPPHCNPNVCAPSAVRRPYFLSRAFLENRMPYLDGIWYVGVAKAEGAHAKFLAWYMLVPWDPFGEKC